MLTLTGDTMSLLPRVAERTRETVAREFDDHGPQQCVAGIITDLGGNNPELLDIARRCAQELGDSRRTMEGFCMFYRLLTLQALQEAASASNSSINMLPRVSAETRDQVARQIGEQTTETFTSNYIAELGRDNPELLQMAHRFATHHGRYLQIMQAIALWWACLVAQLRQDRAQMH
jgi:hypothetical protein